MRPWIRALPDWAVWLGARPYVAGDALDDALSIAHSLAGEGVGVSLDLLGESARDAEEVQTNLESYLHMAESLGAADLLVRPSMSLKLSSCTTAAVGGADEVALHVAEAAAYRGIPLTLDMEWSAWTDYTLELARRLRTSTGADIGVVLQSRLLRTDNDVEAIPGGTRARMVLGIYDEAPDIALQSKAAMKIRMLRQSLRLLERGVYVEFATHDESLIDRFVAQAVGYGKEAFEIQVLHGVPRDALKARLLGEGVSYRVYLPFAMRRAAALAYLRRRLDEYPEMLWLVTKNFFVGI